LFLTSAKAERACEATAVLHAFLKERLLLRRALKTGLFFGDEGLRFVI